MILASDGENLKVAELNFLSDSDPIIASSMIPRHVLLISETNQLLFHDLERPSHGLYKKDKFAELSAFLPYPSHHIHRRSPTIVLFP